MTASIPVSLPNITIPVIDRSTGSMNEAWYRFFEQLQRRTGGDFDAVNENAIAITTKADQTIEIVVGNGLTGGGTLDGNIEIDAKQDTGWTAGTGAGNKGAYAEYAGQTVGAVYAQAEAQATDDAVKAVSGRLTSIEVALRANEGIDG